jgi:hypothetical protein
MKIGNIGSLEGGGKFTTYMIWTKQHKKIPKATWTSLNLKSIFPCCTSSSKASWGKISKGKQANGHSSNLNTIFKGIESNQQGKSKR